MVSSRASRARSENLKVSAEPARFLGASGGRGFLKLTQAQTPADKNRAAAAFSMSTLALTILRWLLQGELPDSATSGTLAAGAGATPVPAAGAGAAAPPAAPKVARSASDEHILSISFCSAARFFTRCRSARASREA